jgi:hypothetical protein
MNKNELKLFSIALGMPFKDTVDHIYNEYLASIKSGLNESDFLHYRDILSGKIERDLFYSFKFKLKINGINIPLVASLNINFLRNIKSKTVTLYIEIDSGRNSNSKTRIAFDVKELEHRILFKDMFSQ